MSFSKTNLILIGVLVGGGILSIGGIVWLGIVTINLAKSNAVLSAELGEVNGKTSGISSLQAEYERLASSSDMMGRQLFSPSRKVALVDDLEQLARKAGVTYVLSNADEKENLSLNMTVKGNFSSVFRFIRFLETMEYRVDFLNAALTRTGSSLSGQPVEWSANLLLSIPILKE